MRTAFIQELTEQARLSPRVFLIVGDLGFSVVEPFAQEFPDRFLNAGVAEQNMTGVAAGLASEGYHVFTYSIANFPTLRCLEQIRNDVCYHNLPVTVVAVGGGVAYGNMGYSHHAVQDLGIMRSLPLMTVLAPADPGEVRECMQWLTAHPGPSYLRIGKAGEPSLHAVRGIDRGPLLIREGNERVAMACTGAILDVALAAADQLLAEGCAIPVYSIPWLNPISPGFFGPLHDYGFVVTLEEHVAVGGLADLLRAALPRSVEIDSFNLDDLNPYHVGGQAYLRQCAGLDVSQVAAACRKRLRGPVNL